MLSPLQNTELIGHAHAEQLLLQAAQTRLPHAWLIAGVKGIGKATLAYRFARFLLAEKNDGTNIDTETVDMFGDSAPKVNASLYVSPQDSAFHRMLQGSHGDFTIIEPTYLDEDGKERASLELRIYQIRQLNSLFGQTASEGGYRVVVIDSADDMNQNAANALLKLLEEPPAMTIFLLISHEPKKLLPTIRSRCRQLNLLPLSKSDMQQVLQQNAFSASKDEVAFATEFADGSPGVALMLLENNAREIYLDVLELLLEPHLKFTKLQLFTQNFTGKNGVTQWDIATFLLQKALHRALKLFVMEDKTNFMAEEEQCFRRLINDYTVDQLFDMWENVSRSVTQAAHLNMDKAYAGVHLFAPFETERGQGNSYEK